MDCRSVVPVQSSATLGDAVRCAGNVRQFLSLRCLEDRGDWCDLLNRLERRLAGEHLERRRMGTIPRRPGGPGGREVKKLRPIANAAMVAGNIYVVLHHFPLTGLLQETLRSAGSGLRGHARARAKGEALSENASPITCPFLCKPGQARGAPNGHR